VRATLEAGEDGLIDLLGVLGLTQEHSAAGATKSLMRGGRDDVGVGYGAFMNAGDDEPGNVGNVTDVVCTDILSYLAKFLEVNFPRIGGGAGDDYLWFVLLARSAI